MEIAEEQIRDACNRLGLTPVGRPEVRGYNTDLDLDEADDWNGDDCWSLAYSVVSGDNYPDAGSLGLAAGHLSPGWRLLRLLVDLVGSDISSGRFDAFDYDSCRDAIKSHADTLAGVMTGPEALVAIADLGVNETTEEAGHRISDWAEDRVSRTLDGLAWELLAYAGYQVCLEVFAETLNSKGKDMVSVPPPEMAEEIDQGSWWPYEGPPEKRTGTGEWALWMDAGGCLCTFPYGDKTPEEMGFLPVYAASRKDLERFLVMFCVKGYEQDERLVHQNGQVWLFNWRSFSLAQVWQASQVADLFCAGDVDGAWAVGNAFGDQIDAAVRAFYEQRNAA